MADMLSGCYECSRACINDQFCEDVQVSLPRHLKIKIIANPAFWGFDDGNGNVLTSGDAYFENGHYDYFDGYDELHFAMKTCGAITTGPYRNEQRPDVNYRTVYDPDDPALTVYGGRRHYGADGTVDNIERGGAEVYLVDRVSLNTADISSCDDSDPTEIYKISPENFGFGTKISTTDTVFKNKTGAWRYIDLTRCYDNTYVESRIVQECDSTAKQHILRDEHFAEEYDPFQLRVSGESGCIPDGHVPSPYQGTISAFYRPSGTEGLIGLTLHNQSLAASGLSNGQAIGIRGGYLNSSYTILNVSHSVTYTSAELAGTFGSGYINETGTSNWSAFGTFDPGSCCGGVAYGVSDTTKRRGNVKNYHADFGRLFNNTKNIIQSNRFIENRYTYGLGTTVQVNPENSLRTVYSTPLLDESGNVELDASGYPIFSQRAPYYGAFYDLDKYDTSTRTDGKFNTTKGNNGTCYSRKASLEVFPDCITQSYLYQECETENDRYRTNQISRLAFVYRGCKFEDNCEFPTSGNPYFAPTGMNDLRNGLAGQEIYMYLNLSTAWGAVILEVPCGCGLEVPPGNLPPEVVDNIASPVTFPSFPKFDLYPVEYGASEFGWQSQFFECEEKCWSGDCQAFPTLTHWDDLRQPYTTYGFIRNLCGHENDDRRRVIIDAFASKTQTGGYVQTGVSTGNDVMYWEFNNPYTHSSGTSEGGFTPSGNYPFWGVADAQGRLVAPYFRTQISEMSGICPGDPVTPFLEFNRCDTWNEGWPTDEVPFLIEIDHSDDCVGCATAIMDPVGYTVTLSSLDTSFLHGPDGSNKYGFNNCRYKGVGYDPTHNCTTGFDKACTGLSHEGLDTKTYNEPYIGETCSVIGGDFELGAVLIPGTQIPIGWQSNAGGANSLVLVGTQGGPDDAFQTFPAVGPYEIYASFKLACEGNHAFLHPNRVNDQNTNFESPTGCRTLSNPLTRLYSGSSTCNNTYPSADSNLKLQVTFLAVSLGIYEEMLKYMPEYAMFGNPYPHDMLQMDVGQEHGNRIWEMLEDLVVVNALGCPSYMDMYGCYNYNEATDYYPASSGFYPCAGGPGAATTPIEECPDYGFSACGDILTYKDKPLHYVPREWHDELGCDCNLQLMRTVRMNGFGTKTITFEAISGCQGDVIAARAYGDLGSTDIIYNDIGRDTLYMAKSNPAASIISTACSWHKGVNAQVSGVTYELMIPTLEAALTVPCSALQPDQCVNSDCEIDPKVGFSTCLDPIPWTGTPPVNGVGVTRRACYPETVIVNKIECEEDGFKLYIDREYHEHNRAWESPTPIPGGEICFPVQKGAYRYINPTGGTSCVGIPYATPSDSVTPVYHNELMDGYYRGVCSTNPSSGTFVTQDFVWGPSPVAVGEDTLWNYFNLFYSGGYPSAEYHEAMYLGSADPEADPPDPENPCTNGTAIISGVTIFTQSEYETPANRFGIDWTNKKHSCIQDAEECGGEFFCNKLFFPRRSYKANTRVSKFGALALCRQNNTLETPGWYTGFQNFSDAGITSIDILNEANAGRFVDPCDNNNITTTTAAVGIDDDYIIVDDYLPLIGVNPNLFKYTFDVKSCVIVSSGCSSTWMPTHTDMSINVGIHTYKTFPQDSKTTFGYYLDKLSSSGTDNCLFNPFKIYLDVECCTSNIRTILQPSNADPTNLEYVLEGVPSWACNGFIKAPACDCQDTTCGVKFQTTYSGDQAEWLPPINQLIEGNGLNKPTTEVVCMNLYLAYESEYISTPPPMGTRTMTCKPLLCVGGAVPDWTDVAITGSPSPYITYPRKFGDWWELEGGEAIIKPVWGLKCGDTIYMPDLFDDICSFNPYSENSGLDISSNCCPYGATCDILANSAPISSEEGCYDFNDLVYNDNSSVWKTCNCVPLNSVYETCDSSVIKATITETI